MDERHRALTAALAMVWVLASGPALPAPGDFGRPAGSGGPLAHAGRATPIAVTDEEREMQNRLWRFLQLPLGPSKTATFSGRGRPADPAAVRAGYWRWLAETPYASARARYARLRDDVEADLISLPAAFGSVCAVAEIDRQRLVAAGGLGGIEMTMIAAAEGRAAANAEAGERFAAALRWRFEGYSYALDHLLVASPYEDAVAIDGRLAELEAWVGAAEEGDFCAAPEPAQAPVPSREMAPVELEPRPLT